MIIFYLCLILISIVDICYKLLCNFTKISKITVYNNMFICIENLKSIHWLIDILLVNNLIKRVKKMSIKDSHSPSPGDRNDWINVVWGMWMI